MSGQSNPPQRDIAGSELDKLASKAEKLLFDLFYKGLEAGEDTVLQYQFERELGYKARYVDRCIKTAKDELADIIQEIRVAHDTEKKQQLLKAIDDGKRSHSMAVIKAAVEEIYKEES